MIKRFLHIALLFVAVFSFTNQAVAQTEKKWDEERKKLKYNKSDKYKGPEEWQGTDPSNMKNRQFTPIIGSGSGSGTSNGPVRYRQGSGSGYRRGANGQPVYGRNGRPSRSSQPGGSGSGGYRQGSGGSGGYQQGSGGRNVYPPGSGGSGSSGSSGSAGSGNSGYQRSGSQGARYSPQQIQRDRQNRNNNIDQDPNDPQGKNRQVQRPKPVQSNPSSPSKSGAKSKSKTKKASRSKEGKKKPSSPIWKFILYMLLCIAILAIVFLIVKNVGPKNEQVAVEVQDDWNPETISKTELELKLEAAMAKGDYRECVRIYFTFILKELIKKGWIRWKKEKTNHHYVMEMGKQGNVLSFMECVRIYDLVWYGNYEIDEDIFEMLQPTLLNYYKSLDPVDE